MIKILLFSFMFLCPVSHVLAQCATNILSTTYASNNGQDGNIFDVVALNDIEIHCFDTHFNPGTINYEIYYKLGSSIGFQSNAGAWFLAGSGSVVSSGNGNATVMNLSAPIQVCQGTTVGFYITNTGGSVPNARYTNGSTLGSVFTSDGNIQILEGYGKSYPFSASYQPRVFNGGVRYNTIILCTPLPIELKDFKVSKGENRTVFVDWSTASEKNNDYFTVEKSKSGKLWIEVERVQGAGNSITEINYQLEDENPFLGISYYRLKQTDFDGKEEISAVKSVDFSVFSSPALKVFPVPAKDCISVIYPNISLTEVLISDVFGCDVSSSFEVIETDKNMMKFSVSNISNGVYFISVDGKSRRIIVSK